MKERILTFAISKLISLFLGNLSVPQVKHELDLLIGRLETLIADSSNTLDDSFLPILTFVRDCFDIPPEKK